MRDDFSNGVLLVDDDPSVRNLLSKRLEKAGFQARQAKDGIDGLVKLREGLPKVIISDLEMPRMAGLEFISVVRRRFPSIPVIGLSGAIPSEVPAEAKPNIWFEKGALQFSELLRAIRALVLNAPDHTYRRQISSVPVRTWRGFGGYFILTCTDCLRTFRAMSTPENEVMEGTAICTYCGADVPFLMESSAPK